MFIFSHHSLSLYGKRQQADYTKFILFLVEERKFFEFVLLLLLLLLFYNILYILPIIDNFMGISKCIIINIIMKHVQIFFWEYY